MNITSPDSWRSVAWQSLRLTRLDGVARSVVGLLVPSEHLKQLLLDRQESQRQREMDMVRGLGTLTLLVASDPTLKKPDLSDAWNIVQRGDSGVTYADVFDPHTAAVLEAIVPAKQAGDVGAAANQPEFTRPPDQPDQADEFHTG